MQRRSWFWMFLEKRAHLAQKDLRLGEHGRVARAVDDDLVRARNLAAHVFGAGKEGPIVATDDDECGNVNRRQVRERNCVMLREDPPGGMHETDCAAVGGRS